MRTSVNSNRRTPESNIPVLVARSVTVDNGTATIGFEEGSTIGVFARFHGVFILKLNDEILKVMGQATYVAVSEIYGAARDLYKGASKVTVSDIDGFLHVLCYYDTNNSMLYMVR